MIDSSLVRLLMALALALGVSGLGGANARAQDPDDPRGARGSAAEVELPIRLQRSARVPQSVGGAIDMEVLAELISARLGQLREESIRRLLTELGAEASRPLEDLAETLADLLDDSSDPAARAQMLVAALVRDALSYLLAAAAKEGWIDRGQCADDIHVLATTAYEGMAKTTRLARLGFPLATGSAPEGCDALAVAIGTFIEVAGSGRFNEILDRLRELGAEGTFQTALHTELSAVATACVADGATVDLQAIAPDRPVPTALDDLSAETPADDAACEAAQEDAQLYEALAGLIRSTSRPIRSAELEGVLRVAARAAPRDQAAQPAPAGDPIHEAAELAFSALEVVLRALADSDSGVTRGDVEAILDRLIALIEPKLEDESTRRIVVGSLRSVRAALRDGASGGLLAVTIDPLVLVSTMSREMSEISVGDWSFYLRANVSLGYFYDADAEFVAAGFEELGAGIRWQPCPDIFLGAHLATSGILLSITEPNGEPLDVIFAGGGVSVNVFRLVDFSATFGVLFATEGDWNPRFGMLIGAGVPLPDYVAAIADVASEE